MKKTDAPRYCACGCGQLLPHTARRETKYLRTCFLSRSLVDARFYLSSLPLDDAIRAIRKSAYDQGKLSGTYYERQRARRAFARTFASRRLTNTSTL